MQKEQAWISITEAQFKLAEQLHVLTSDWTLDYRIAWQIIEHRLAGGDLLSRTEAPEHYALILEGTRTGRAFWQAIPLGERHIIPADFWLHYSLAAEEHDRHWNLMRDLDREGGAEREGGQFRFVLSHGLVDDLVMRGRVSDVLVQEWPVGLSIRVSKLGKRGRPRWSDDAILEQMKIHMQQTGETRPYVLAKPFLERADGNSDDAKQRRLVDKFKCLLKLKT